MKVFQVVKCTGSYEDYYEHVVGTYIDKSVAKLSMDANMLRSEVLLNKYNHCCACESVDTWCYLSDDDGYCINSCQYDELVDATYVLKEFEVIE